MEIVLNCVWLVLGLSLLTSWSVHEWRTRGSLLQNQRPSRRLQLVALLLLIGLLFPVISVTDDFAMCTAPREAEQAMSLHRLHDGACPASTAPAVFTWQRLAGLILPTGPGWLFDPETRLGPQRAGTRLTIDSRPPPVRL